MLSIAWLISCNGNKQQTIDLISAYSDSLGIAQEQMHMLDYKLDLITKKYVDSFPAKAFASNQITERGQFRQNEKAAYHAMLHDRDAMRQEVFPKKLYLQIRIVYFKSMLDSLKNEVDE